MFFSRLFVVVGSSLTLAANGLGIAEGGDLRAQSLNLAQRYIKCTNVRFSTEAPLLAIPCCMPFLLFGHKIGKHIYHYSKE